MEKVYCKNCKSFNNHVGRCYHIERYSVFDKTTGKTLRLSTDHFGEEEKLNKSNKCKFYSEKLIYKLFG